ncbi:kinase-like domain-containing protein [Rhizophagus clarus]|uniref:Kinase-like domain-containing protein n=1 Tax=Rhizophagus clarus TaxID=94130 RepID=A0A8H3LRK2_9GLOM|nr:kinase-like domain-containing protein [Rhizophagus clarus]
MSKNEIGSGGFSKVFRANWKKSHIRYAIKSFFKIDNATIKAIVREIQLQREVDYHDNVIRFYGVTSSSKDHMGQNTPQRRGDWSLKERKHRERFCLVWKDCPEAQHTQRLTIRHTIGPVETPLGTNPLAIPTRLTRTRLVKRAHAIDREGIIHRDLHSSNVLIHQHTVKLSGFGLSKRIEETSNSQSKAFVSSGQPPFHGTPYDVGLAISILQGLRETPVPETSENYIKIYTDCWNIEPDNRPLSINNYQPNSDAEILENNYSFRENSSQVIDFTRTNDMESSILSNNKTEDDFINNIINFF